MCPLPDWCYRVGKLPLCTLHCVNHHLSLFALAATCSVEPMACSLAELDAAFALINWFWVLLRAMVTAFV